MDFLEVDLDNAPAANIICETEKKFVVKEEQKFYTDALQYWSEIPATVDGMLGGFGHISEIDIQGKIIKVLKKNSTFA